MVCAPDVFKSCQILNLGTSLRTILCALFWLGRSIKYSKNYSTELVQNNIE